MQQRIKAGANRLPAVALDDQHAGQEVDVPGDVVVVGLLIEPRPPREDGVLPASLRVPTVAKVAMPGRSNQFPVEYCAGVSTVMRISGWVLNGPGSEWFL